MTNEEKLRLWAYQWAMHGERPRDLPRDVEFVVVESDATNITYTLWDRPYDIDHIEMRRFVLESAYTVKTCRAGYGEKTKVFVVTPVETQAKPKADTEIH